MKVVGFTGRSGSGKTTFIEKLIPELKGRGLKVGTIKHDAHEFEIDKPGKDSYRHRAAGADIGVITSDTKLAMVKRLDAPLNVREIMDGLMADMDIVIVEGYKSEPIPRIEVIRKEEGREMIFDPAELLAVVTDLDLALDIPVFGLEDTSSVADLIVNKVAQF